MLATLSLPDAGDETHDAGPLLGVLDQLSELLAGLPDEDYTRKPVGVVPSSIGGHVRHCLDHVESLLSALECDEIEYDHRRRDTVIERCRRTALVALASVKHRVAEEIWAEKALTLTILLDPAGIPNKVGTTVGRELAFVLSHTVHHNALIAVLVKLQGNSVPATFGYAPSTIAHRENRACVR